MGPCFRRDDSVFCSRLFQNAKTPERDVDPAPAPQSSQSSRGVEAGDCLDLEIFFQTVFAPFAAVAGLLVAAERRGAVVRHTLRGDVAGADLSANLAGGLHAVGRAVTAQAVRRVGGEP